MTLPPNGGSVPPSRPSARPERVRPRLEDGPLAPAVALLCGGESRRFPGGKLRASFRGQPLLQAVAAKVAPAAHRRLLVGELPAGLPPPDGWEHIPDPPGPRGGPGAGLMAAAMACPEGFVLAAGDMPFVDAPLLVALWRAMGPSPSACLVLESRPSPLPCALGPLGVARLQDRSQGSSSAPALLSLLRMVGLRAVPAGRVGLYEAGLARLLEDVDTPAELALAESRPPPPSET